MAEEVIEEVLWTDSAKLTFSKIVDYLSEEWTEREVGNFVKHVNDMLSALKSFPEMCRPSQKRKYVRIGILNRHTQMVYHYRPGQKQLTVLLFWNFKQDPSRFKY
ncbi:MAG: type II toxin-antitoxin system RelE/ParE family toxin [Candidatus Pseudobacter hemicellulosilyticus]|uniref:Type II toxin-antitoxin system RelE/ParE family toxin n=1 Tax=Candidatus Pseudobacter hemicellulosilyticus TaxID=3121375 RepID=A0AAJ5WVC0_9BACT|nr:MAG: type II toxin-antitoxin system RelE/ParE family toxin [Pseudobacter sp.]